MMSLRFGADRLAADPTLLGNVRRVGLATNDAARSAVDATAPTRALLLSAGVPVVRLFSPEHGLSALAADGTGVGDGIDSLTNLPVTSLYGERFAPPLDLLRSVDAVLFDIPDVGARFYTYTWTLTHLIDACAAAGIPLVVLDRPNPLGGTFESAEGPLLEPSCASFIGRHTIPIRHSLTLGEFARLWRKEQRPDADVRIIECAGWRRELLWPLTNLPFVRTSPAIANFSAALLYPGLCLFEATNVSVGRGSPLSFEAIGAPWLNADVVAERFRAQGMPGVDVACTEFTPTAAPYAGEACRALQLVCTDIEAIRPVRVGLTLLGAVIAAQRDRFAWTNYPTAANPSGSGHFEKLIGVHGMRGQLERNADSIDSALLDQWTSARGWEERWRSVLAY